MDKNIDMLKPIIYTKNLIKNYGHGNSMCRALRGLDIQIFPKEFVIIFGPSGSGKSTLLNILSGLENPTSGVVNVDGQRFDNLDNEEKAVFHRDKIGMVFQAYNLIPSLTVIQNITLPLVFSQTNKRERLTKAYQLLESFKLKEIANRLPTEISGGQMQRVGIMRALISDPPIIIADEPTGNLDSVSTKNVMKIFSQLNEKNQRTLIVVTHDTSLFAYADRIIYILDGKVIKEKSYGRTKTKVKPKKTETAFTSLVAAEKDPVYRKIWDILAMLLSNEQLEHLEKSELMRIGDSIRKRINNKINKEQLFKELDKPFIEGGAGLYVQTSIHLAESIENIMKIMA